jgi:tRNA(Ile)-lysidine synthase
VADKAIRFESLIGEFIRAERLIDSGNLVLAAVSGGQDSMAMLAVLNALAHPMGFKLAVAHLDHKLRDNSIEDRKIVEAFAKQCGLPLHAGEEDVRALARESADTLEEAARRARYSFLETVADKIGADRIATGHTSDDQAETIIMRIIRGTGIRGLAGIPVSRGRLIRPLLRIPRTETERYCRAHAIPFMRDPSNTDTRFMRNRIRHELLPLLKTSFHPGVEINLLNLCLNAQRIVSSIREWTAPLISSRLRQTEPDTWHLDLEGMKELDESTMFLLFSDIFADHLQCDMDFTQSHYEMLISLCTAEGRSGKRLSLPGVRIKREYDTLIMSKGALRTEPEASGPVVLSSLKTFSRGVRVPGTTDAPGVTVVARTFRNDGYFPRSLVSTQTTAYFALESVSPPLAIRTPMPGDRIRPFGMSGSKKLSDIFIDKKIPGRQRAGTLIVADAKEIMWAVGIVTSEQYRVSRETKEILKITVLRK